MIDYINKLREQINHFVIVLDGAVITSKHPQLIEQVRLLEQKLKPLLDSPFYEAIDYDKIIERLVEDYIVFVDYLIDSLRGRMKWGESVQDRVEAVEINEVEKTPETKKPIAPKKQKPFKKKK